MLSVPRVTMNGGSFTRVTSTPLSVPARAATTMPIASAATPGTPWSDDTLAITIADRMAMAPTDRSMPAVRMTIVWPTARAATTAACCSSSEIVVG